jgi:ATP-dependent Clp protease ATP-binding subunit ClpB
VRIQDAALVAAATLSQRYISDRFLPDKAIDLIDEAAAKLKMEIDSVPGEVDELSRRVTQLEIERQALKQETDLASRDRLAKLDRELANLNEELQTMKARWQSEKDVITRIAASRRRSSKPRPMPSARNATPRTSARRCSNTTRCRSCRKSSTRRPRIWRCSRKTARC